MLQSLKTFFPVISSRKLFYAKLNSKTELCKMWLVGGIPSIAGGSFADGFRQGVITSGLNHAMNHMAQEIKIRNVIKELEKNYPKHSKYRTNELYELIGGPLLDWYNETQTNNDPNDDLSLCNTCAVRISRALNYTKGLEIPAKPGNGIETFKGGDGLNYIINATHMAKYLTENFGKKSFYKGTEFTPRNGIIAMYSSNSKNARVNHVDLVVKGRWIGLQDMSPKFFKIWF
jgi:hypothetical protein